jgi:hypothetical protein
MFEGIFDCEIHWTEHFKDGRALPIDAKDKGTERIECEPIYYYSKTLNRCRKGATEPDFQDLDFFMEIGRRGEGKLWPVIHQPAFCAARPAFHLLLPNAWIED